MQAVRGKRMKGLEPSTFCMASRRSSQLSYIRASAEYRSAEIIARALRGALPSRVRDPRRGAGDRGRTLSRRWPAGPRWARGHCPCSDSDARWSLRWRRSLRCSTSTPSEASSRCWRSCLRTCSCWSAMSLCCLTPPGPPRRWHRRALPRYRGRRASSGCVIARWNLPWLVDAIQSTAAR